MWYVIKDDELYHHGIKGQKWGVRRFQNPDGTLTDAGKKRYGGNYKYSPERLYDDIQKNGWNMSSVRAMRMLSPDQRNRLQQKRDTYNATRKQYDKAYKAWESDHVKRAEVSSGIREKDLKSIQDRMAFDQALMNEEFKSTKARRLMEESNKSYNQARKEYTEERKALVRELLKDYYDKTITEIGYYGGEYETLARTILESKIR